MYSILQILLHDHITSMAERNILWGLGIVIKTSEYKTKCKI